MSSYLKSYVGAKEVPTQWKTWSCGLMPIPEQIGKKRKVLNSKLTFVSRFSSLLPLILTETPSNLTLIVWQQRLI